MVRWHGSSCDTHKPMAEVVLVLLLLLAVAVVGEKCVNRSRQAAKRHDSHHSAKSLTLSDPVVARRFNPCSRPDVCPYSNP